MQVSRAQRRLTVQYVALYQPSDAQGSFHKPLQTDVQTLPNVLSPLFHSR